MIGELDYYHNWLLWVIEKIKKILQCVNTYGNYKIASSDERVIGLGYA
jgi:hypothetical protein